jgi:hypothetical protein
MNEGRGQEASMLKAYPTGMLSASVRVASRRDRVRRHRANSVFFIPRWLRSEPSRILFVTLYTYSFIFNHDDKSEGYVY